MMTLGKMAAAANGPRSVKSMGGVSLRSLKAPHSSTSAPAGGIRASMAGMRSNKRAYVQPHGGGYEGLPPKKPTQASPVPPSSFPLGVTTRHTSTNLSRYSRPGLLTDRDLAALL